MVGSSTSLHPISQTMMEARVGLGLFQPGHSHVLSCLCPVSPHLLPSKRALGRTIPTSSRLSEVQPRVQQGTNGMALPAHWLLWPRNPRRCPPVSCPLCFEEPHHSAHPAHHHPPQAPITAPNAKQGKQPSARNGRIKDPGGRPRWMMHSCFLPALHQRTAGKLSRSHPHPSASLSYSLSLAAGRASPLGTCAAELGFPGAFPCSACPLPKEGRSVPQSASPQKGSNKARLSPGSWGSMLCSLRHHRAASSGPSGQHRLHNSSLQQGFRAKGLSRRSQRHQYLMNTQGSPGTVKPSAKEGLQVREPGPG